VLDPTPPNVPSPTANEGVFKLILNYDLDAFYDSIMNTTAKFPRSTYTEMTVDSTDLSVFRNRGGKVVTYQPQSGGPFSALSMVDWYQHLNIASGGTTSDYTAAPVVCASVPYARCAALRRRTVHEHDRCFRRGRELG
jgi:hypothetical protein